MNISRINLNLLVALDALLSEQHVTRAGEKIGITQSAMSSALNQLRELFKDELLLRTPKGMVPTVRALELAPQVRQIIEEFQTLINYEIDFDPKSSQRVFTIGMSDYMEAVLLPRLTKIISQQAPEVQLKIKHINYFDASVPIDNYDIDIAIVFKIEELSRIQQINIEELFKVSAVCVAHEDLPLIQKNLSLDDYLNADHIKIAYEDIDKGSSLRNRIDIALKKLGVERKPPITVSHYLPVLFTLSETQLVATLPDIFPENLLKELKLKTQPLPFHIPQAKAISIWHKQFDNDLGHQWLRKILKRTAQAIQAYHNTP